MQSHQPILKKYGHNRRPSYGSKMMPISSILLNLSGEPPRHFESISKDGISPEREIHPILFNFNDTKLSATNQSDPSEPSSNDCIQTATTNFIEHESRNGSIPQANDNDNSEYLEVDYDKAFPKCVNYHYGSNNPNDTADNKGINIAGDDKNNDKPCLICARDVANDNVTNDKDNRFSGIDEIKESHEQQQPFLELCQVLCDDSCKKTRKMSEKSDTAASIVDAKPGTLARQNSSRQEFLASMLMVDRRISDTSNIVKPSIVTNPQSGELQSIYVQEAIIVPLTEENLKEFDENYFRDKLAVAEALAQASIMTSPAVRRRLAARKLEMELSDGDFVYDADNEEFVPPKQLLMYLVRY